MFEKATVEVIKFDATDVITASCSVAAMGSDCPGDDMQ